MTKKKSKRKPRKPSGPNPFYPTHSVLVKLARVLAWVQADDCSLLTDDVTEDPELTAWLDAMRKRGALK